MYHFNPCSQTTVRKKENTKKQKNENIADGRCPCEFGLRHKLPFRDVPIRCRYHRIKDIYVVGADDR